MHLSHTLPLSERIPEVAVEDVHQGVGEVLEERFELFAFRMRAEGNHERDPQSRDYLFHYLRSLIILNYITRIALPAGKRWSHAIFRCTGWSRTVSWYRANHDSFWASSWHLGIDWK